MVRRAIRDAWSFADPAAVLDARRTAAGAALHRILGDVDVRDAARIASDAARAAPVSGRPMFAAHRALPWPDDPLLQLWHAATLLREHRGDGHVVALVTAGLDGIDAHVLQALEGAVPRASLQPNRGWTDDEWTASEARLRARGDLAALKLAVEDATDVAAARPYETVDGEQLCRLLEPLRAAIVAAGGIPVPNPMGVPDARSATS